MKRYIRNSSELGEDVVLRDNITIIIDITPTIAASTRTWSDYTRFPGKEKFKSDVLHVLENEYHFQVMDDDYNGIMQKGWTSDRHDSASLYFNTFYDLRNAQEALDRADYRIDAKDVEGKVFCYILFRISDHDVDSRFTQEHAKFVDSTIKKHTNDRGDVLIKEEDTIILDEAALWQHYNDAIEDLRYAIEGRISAWVRIAKKYRFKI